MLIAVINQSTLVRNDDVATMARACASQLRFHASPAWERQPGSVVYYDSEAAVPPNSHVISVMDDGDQQGALGWHTEDNPGVIFGRVFARPVLDAGGDSLSHDPSVASVLSHEVLEMFVDPNINLWADDFAGRAYAVEACDPVEAQSYMVDGVAVSNFVYPSWFDAHAAPGSKFDHLGEVTHQFTMTPQGYVIYEQEGQQQQEVGDRYPQWRRGMKSANLARTARRAAHVGRSGPGETSPG